MTAQIRSTYGEKYMLNQINTKFPTYNAYVINIWHNTKGKRLQRYQQFSVPSDLPDAIGHEYDKNIDAHLLFSATKIKWSNVE